MTFTVKVLFTGTVYCNLETLAAVFRQEMIVPSILHSMSNEKIERLDVTAIGD